MAHDFRASRTRSCSGAIPATGFRTLRRDKPPDEIKTQPLQRDFTDMDGPHEPGSGRPPRSPMRMPGAISLAGAPNWRADGAGQSSRPTVRAANDILECGQLLDADGSRACSLPVPMPISAPIPNRRRRQVNQAFHYNGGLVPRGSLGGAFSVTMLWCGASRVTDGGWHLRRRRRFSPR